MKFQGGPDWEQRNNSKYLDLECLQGQLLFGRSGGKSQQGHTTSALTSPHHSWRLSSCTFLIEPACIIILEKIGIIWDAMSFKSRTLKLIKFDSQNESLKWYHHHPVRNHSSARTSNFRSGQQSRLKNKLHGSTEAGNEWHKRLIYQNNGQVHIRTDSVFNFCMRLTLKQLKQLYTKLGLVDRFFCRTQRCAELRAPLCPEDDNHRTRCGEMISSNGIHATTTTDWLMIATNSKTCSKPTQSRIHKLIPRLTLNRAKLPISHRVYLDDLSQNFVGSHTPIRQPFLQMPKECCRSM